MVSILPMVDLLGNTAVDWFCILSYFRLDTLHNDIKDTGIGTVAERGHECPKLVTPPICFARAHGKTVFGITKRPILIYLQPLR